MPPLTVQVQSNDGQCQLGMAVRWAGGERERVVVVIGGRGIVILAVHDDFPIVHPPTPKTEAHYLSLVTVA